MFLFYDKFLSSFPTYYSTSIPFFNIFCSSFSIHFTNLPSLNRSLLVYYKSTSFSFYQSFLILLFLDNDLFLKNCLFSIPYRFWKFINDVFISSSCMVKNLSKSNMSYYMLISMAECYDCIYQMKTNGKFSYILDCYLF